MAEQAREQNEQLLQHLFTAAQPGAVFDKPVTSGAYTIVTASELSVGGGAGFASAAGIGGGGGGSMGRPVAVIVVGPDNVKIQSITDVTKIALATLAAWVPVALMAMRLARKRRKDAKVHA